VLVVVRLSIGFKHRDMYVKYIFVKYIAFNFGFYF
jgi:hypothetical protein